MIHPRMLRAVEAASLALFFLQALRAAFSSLFGIIYDQIFEGPTTAWLGVSVALLLLALLAPAAAPPTWGRGWLATLACLAALARVPLSINDALIRYLAALIVLAAAGLYLAGLLVARRPLVFPTLVAALAFDQVLLAAGWTYDLSLRSAWLPVQVAWAALVVGLAFTLARRKGAGGQQPGRLSVAAGLGLGALLFLESSLLNLPHAVARFGDVPYLPVAVALLLITLLPLIPRIRFVLMRAMANTPGMRIAAAAGLPLLLLIAFAWNGPASALALMLAHAAALAGLACLIDGRSSRARAPGAMLALGLGLLLALNFFNAFAFTYPYTIPALRGLGWAVYLAAGVAAMVGVLGQIPLALPWSEVAGRTGLRIAAGLAVLAIVAASAWPQPADPLPVEGPLRAASYNIHYGYDSTWRFTLAEIARTIEAESLDVIALQEVDAGRLTSFAADNAHFLARALRMNAAYLPTVERLTGIAVLYRGPAVAAEARLLSSLQEQTGIVAVPLSMGERTVHAFGVWLGLSDEDTQRQIGEALEFIGARSPALFGGDFNAAPGSPVAEAIEAAGFIDPFAALAIDPAPPTAPAIDPQERIDFVWLRGLQPLRAWVPGSLASDHRMVVVEAGLGP